MGISLELSFFIKSQASSAFIWLHTHRGIEKECGAAHGQRIDKVNYTAVLSAIKPMNLIKKSLL